MRRPLTTIISIIIGLAIIGFFYFGLMQRPVIAPVSAPESGSETTIDLAAGTDTATEAALPDAQAENDAESESAVALIEEPTDEPAEEPVEEPTEEPAEEPTEEPAEEQPTEEPAEEQPTEEPAEEPTEEPAEEPTIESTEEPAQEQSETVTVYDYEIVASYPHDPEAFLQGLVWLDGLWYEGTGLYKESTLRKVDPESGEVIEQVKIDDELFGEGITVFEDKIYQLTWKAQRGFIYDKESFELLEEFTYPTQGWGITHDGERLIMSDGTATIYFWDPETLEEIDSIVVTNQGEPVRNLNELEYIDGLIYANIWQTNFILMINPDTGVVQSVINLNGLLDPADVTGPVDVLNGIAYDEAGERLFVTGKLWPKIYEIKLIEQ